MSVWVEIFPFWWLSERQSVTLHVSVWVEISSSVRLEMINLVTLHVSVWVEIWVMSVKRTQDPVTLHVSVWVEILIPKSILPQHLSRSTWACELKCGNIHQNMFSFCHAPRERVSWNFLMILLPFQIFVTLHVSVWVEINKVRREHSKYPVTLHVSVWVEMTIWSSWH